MCLARLAAGAGDLIDKGLAGIFLTAATVFQQKSLEGLEALECQQSI